MSTIARPNRDALHKALDIYSDAMRPFLVRIEMNPVFRNFSFKNRKDLRKNYLLGIQKSYIIVGQGYFGKKSLPQFLHKIVSKYAIRFRIVSLVY